MSKIRILGTGMDFTLDYPQGVGPVTLQLALEANGQSYRDDLAYTGQEGDILKADSPVEPESTVFVGKPSTSG